MSSQARVVDSPGFPTKLSMNFSFPPRVQYFPTVFLSCFFYFFDLFYILTVSVEGYCCNSSHTMEHIHTNRLDKTSLYKGSARRRDICLTTHNIHNGKTSMPWPGFEPEILESERL
jgi:hypothetical protein